MNATLREQLIERAGLRVFQRGEEYLAWNRVRDAIACDETIGATVDGSRSYRVILRTGGSRLESQCDCPEGNAGRCCKHVVAVGLHWLRLCTNGDATNNLRAALDQLPRETLTGLLLDEAAANARLAHRLRLRVAQASGQSPDFDDYARLLEFASAAAFSAEPESESFPRVLIETDEALRALLEAGYTDEAARLIEAAPVFRQAQTTDAARALIELLLGLHHRAWQQLKLPPDTMARRLVDWRIHSRAVDDEALRRRYAELLGAAGLKSYARAIEAESSRLIATRSQTLHDADDYLELARLCEQASQDDLALDWASRGCEQFPHAVALLEFLAARHDARGETQAALETRFRLFCAQPSLERYQQLAEAARSTGALDAWRARALDAAWQSESGVAARVAIHLSEGDDEAAWQAAWAAERQRDCSDDLWLELARRRASRCPDDTLHIYQRLISQHADRKNEYAYGQVIELLRRMRQLMTRLKRRDEFFAYVNELRKHHRSQRTFVKRLDQLLSRSARKPRP